MSKTITDLTQLKAEDEPTARQQGMILVYHKPVGITSHDVVLRVRRHLRQLGWGKIKVGHAGTLDPLAEGVLLILIGAATKRQPELIKLPKHYQTKLWLGVGSETDDLEGPLLWTSKAWQTAQQLTQSQIETALAEFRGQIKQQVPAYSAIKHKGKKLYQLARKGQITGDDLPVKTRQIYQLELRNWTEEAVDWQRLPWSSDSRQRLAQGMKDNQLLIPTVELELRCSSGTYVRALARDLGKKLGTLATCRQITRLAVGEWR